MLVKAVKSEVADGVMTLTRDTIEVREHSAEKVSEAHQVGVLEGVGSSVCKNDYSHLGGGALDGSHCSGEGSISNRGCHRQPVVQRGLNGGDAACRHNSSLVLPEEADSSAVEGCPSIRVFKVFRGCMSQTGLSGDGCILGGRHVSVGCWYTNPGNA